MFAVRLPTAVALTAGLLTLGVAGCRDVEPVPSHHRDLGQDGRALLPTVSVRLVAGIAGGKADWPGFREPNFDEQPDSADEGSAAAAAGQSGEEAAIRELIDEYNEFVPDATVDELLEYFAEDQGDAIRPILETQRQVSTILAELRAQLSSAVPDEGARVTAALDAVAAGFDCKLHVDSITMAGEGEATAVVSDPHISGMRMRVIEEDWFFELAGDLAQVKSGYDDSLATYRGMLDGVRSGGTAPSEVLQQIESNAAESAEASAATGSGETPTSDEPADGEEEAETSDDG